MARGRSPAGIGAQAAPLLRIAAVVLVVGILYLAQDVLIPIALAVLLSFLLTPLCNRLEGWGLARTPAVLTVAVLAFAAIGGAGYLVSYQVYTLAEQLPRYRQNIEERLRSLQGSGGGVFGEAAKVVEKAQENVQREIKREEQAREDRRQQEQPPPGVDSAGQPSAPASPERTTPASPVSPTAPEATAEPEPIPVRIVGEVHSTFSYVRDYLGAVLAPIATAGIVIVFVLFTLIQRDDLRDRVVRLAGLGRLELTTRALDDASARISRYLLMQLIVNATYGIPVGLGLWAIGVPGAMLWGLLATLLRFIPFVGPWIAASMPILLSLAVFDGWMKPLAVIGLYGALELFSNNVLETWLYGASTGMSAVAVLVAAVFWSWLWGPIGLLLAVPMTACVVVLGRHVPQLHFFAILFGSEPALPPAERFYQRVLTLDEDEAMEIAVEHREADGLMALYDRMIVPALHLEERYRHEGRLPGDQERRVRRMLREIVEELLEWTPGEDEAKEIQAGPPTNPANRNGGERGPGGGWKNTLKNALHRRKPRPPTEQTPARRTVSGEPAAPLPVESPLKNTGARSAGLLLCLPAGDEADELAARMLAHALRVHGIAIEVVPVAGLAGERIERVREADPALVCVSAMPPAASAHARYLCKHLKRQLPELRILVGLWDVSGTFERTEQRLLESGAAHVATTFQAALDRIRRNPL